MEYCVQAWSSHLHKDIQILKMVQRAATIVPHLKTRNYKDRLSQLGLTTLGTRRLRGDLIKTFKIMTDRENLDKNLFFFQLSTSGHGLRNLRLKLAVSRCRLDNRKYSFRHPVVTDWNQLPEHVVMSPSVNAFKSRLDKHWTDMGI